MEAHLTALLAEIEQHGRENDARESDHKKKMLNLEPDTARLVYILARSSGAKRVLEIGTSNGYSTIWLASAVAPNGGRVTKHRPQRGKAGHGARKFAARGAARVGGIGSWQSRNHRRRAGWPVRCGVSSTRIGSVRRESGSADGQARPSVLLLADNVTSHPDEIAGYLTVVRKSKGSSTWWFRLGRDSAWRIAEQDHASGADEARSQNICGGTGSE